MKITDEIITISIAQLALLQLFRYSLKKNIVDNNEGFLKKISEKEGEIAGIGIEKKVRAIKKGLLEDEMYCKHCGESIDADSKYCKKCGKEQQFFFFY